MHGPEALVPSLVAHVAPHRGESEGGHEDQEGRNNGGDDGNDVCGHEVSPLIPAKPFADGFALMEIKGMRTDQAVVGAFRSAI